MAPRRPQQVIAPLVALAVLSTPAFSAAVNASTTSAGASAPTSTVLVTETSVVTLYALTTVQAAAAAAATPTSTSSIVVNATSSAAIGLAASNASTAVVTAATAVSTSPSTSSNYSLVKLYAGETFFDEWTFWGNYDNLTGGSTDYVSGTGDLAYVNSAGNAIMKVDNATEISNGSNRGSVRIETQETYGVGSLWIMDALHVPYGCSTWPAFWSATKSWPAGGEIDTFETVNLQSTNQMAVLNGNNGCTVRDIQASSAGAPFASGGGGVWATELAETGISIWFFPRDSVPADLRNSSAMPLPATWGTPSAYYSSSSCDIPSFFSPQRLTFDIALCGDWAGNSAVFAETCSGSCYNDYVLNASAYDTAYFEVQRVAVYTTNATELSEGLALQSTLTAQVRAQVLFAGAKRYIMPAPVFRPVFPSSSRLGRQPSTDELSEKDEEKPLDDTASRASSISLSHYSPIKRRHSEAFVSRRKTAEDFKLKEPWHKSRDGRRALSNQYWVFVTLVFLGGSGAVLLLFFTWWNLPRHEYCLILDENFDGHSLNTSIWNREVQSGGFDNNEFEWTTLSPNNTLIQDGVLTLVPTLTSESIGEAAVVDGYTLNLTALGTCTSDVPANCIITSDASKGTIIPPIQTARINTNGTRTMKYGRVEIRVRAPTGSWLWPRVMLLPVNNVYGAWPKSGEIDIYESMGNPVTGRYQNYVNSAQSILHWGPAADLDRYYFTKGMITRISTWKDSRARNVFQHSWKQTLWSLGDFTASTSNGSIVTNPWTSSNHSKMAPFDQEFFLTLHLGVGGTNGYFLDDADKPWSNDALTPASEFWAAKSQWWPTWAGDHRRRGFGIDYVKMWTIKEKGVVSWISFFRKSNSL
ncbi:hypothetical protein MNV49_000498 [Pseudohyphozyma bogoriensis]|nr:hypothetical protein MNV49_000498 [Pseudohyphozyma bogoriensis]